MTHAEAWGALWMMSGSRYERVNVPTAARVAKEQTKARLAEGTPQGEEVGGPVVRELIGGAEAKLVPIMDDQGYVTAERAVEADLEGVGRVMR